MGRDRQWEKRRAEEEKVGCRSRGEAGEPQNHRVEEGEEVQGEGQDLGGSWAGEKPWGEPEVGGLDSARWYASEMELRIVHHCTPCLEVEEAGNHRDQVEGEGSWDRKHTSLYSGQGNQK